jgi:putative methionine-R-sulfoxide reductase with GAF domain
MENGIQTKSNTVLSPSQAPSDDPSTPSKQNKEMSSEEQAKYYKDLFIKSKKLILKYEEKIKNIEEANSNLKNKLKEYEAGMYIIK